MGVDNTPGKYFNSYARPAASQPKNNKDEEEDGGGSGGGGGLGRIDKLEGPQWGATGNVSGRLRSDIFNKTAAGGMPSFLDRAMAGSGMGNAGAAGDLDYYGKTAAGGVPSFVRPKAETFGKTAAGGIPTFTRESMGGGLRGRGGVSFLDRANPNWRSAAGGTLVDPNSPIPLWRQSNYLNANNAGIVPESDPTKIVPIPAVGETPNPSGIVQEQIGQRGAGGNQTIYIDPQSPIALINRKLKGAKTTFYPPENGVGANSPYNNPLAESGVGVPLPSDYGPANNTLPAPATAPSLLQRATAPSGYVSGAPSAGGVIQPQTNAAPLAGRPDNVGAPSAGISQPAAPGGGLSPDVQKQITELARLTGQTPEQITAALKLNGQDPNANVGDRSIQQPYRPSYYDPNGNLIKGGYSASEVINPLADAGNTTGTGAAYVETTNQYGEKVREKYDPVLHQGLTPQIAGYYISGYGADGKPLYTPIDLQKTAAFIRRYQGGGGGGGGGGGYSRSQAWQTGLANWNIGVGY